MNAHADKTQENKSQSVSNETSKKQGVGESTFQFVDNRPESVAQRELQEMANNSPQAKQAVQLQSMADNHSAQKQQPVQKKENNTGLPDNLKAGMENLSGMSLDDVKVHRNSDKPAQLQAHAYAQGTDIHLGAGQEKHLPHEAWHVVQQKQGRVKPTMQMKGKLNINDDAGLEKEADVMGAKALQMTSKENKSRTFTNSTNQKSNNVKQGSGFVDNPAQILVQRQIQDTSLQKQSKYLTQSTSGAVIQAVLNQQHVQKAMELLGLKKSKVIEVPKNKAINALTTFSDYPEGSTYGLEEGDLVKSIAGINYGDNAGQYAETSANDILSLSGGAGYVNGLALVSEGMEDYERSLTHELGHHKQESLGYTFENTSVMLLEYHNVLMNENLFGEPFRVCYTQDMTPGWVKKWDKTDDKGTLIDNFEGQASTALNALHKIVEKSSKPKDILIYGEIMSKLEELETKLSLDNVEWRFVLARFIWNLAKEAGQKSVNK